MGENRRDETRRGRAGRLTLAALFAEVMESLSATDLAETAARLADDIEATQRLIGRSPDARHRVRLKQLQVVRRMALERLDELQESGR